MKKTTDQDRRRGGGRWKCHERTCNHVDSWLLRRGFRREDGSGTRLLLLPLRGRGDAGLGLFEKLSKEVVIHRLLESRLEVGRGFEVSCAAAHVDELLELAR